MNRTCLSLLLFIALTPAAFCQQVQEPGFSTTAAIEQRLVEVRQEQAELAEDAGTNGEAELLRQLEIALVQHREALGYLGQVRQEAGEIEEAKNAWKGLADPPPYSVQFADQLRAQQDALQRQLSATESRLRIIARATDDSNATLAEHQRLARQLREEAESADSAEAKQHAESAAGLEQISSRIAVETLARLRLRQNAHEIQQAGLTAALELATLKTNAVKGKVQFTRSELDAIQRKISEARKQLLDSEVPAAGSAEEHHRQITWKIDILDIERDFWNATFLAFNAKSATGAEHAVETLQALQSKADDWVELTRLQARDSTGVESLSIGAIASQGDIKRVVDLQLKIRYVLDLLGGQTVSVPGVLDHLANAFYTIWGMELYLAEETNSVAGEKVTTYSAVTLAKNLRLVLILLVGWFVLRFLARRLQSLLQHRFGSDPARADLVRRWTFGLGLTILLIYGLNRVHIPFTAFAFLGGTLAIGIGFGAQTLLKNFISGVILSIERPFKLGDLVQVETIMGNIVHIGLRASVIRHFDGTDTLVPNSSLLENRVSNWTFADNAMRDRISVGVAYGSSSRVVSRALLGVAESHGQVLKKPEPTVQFEEFGDNALKFSLLYWFDAMAVRPEPLASDLRFMAEHALRDQDVVVAFPQRDIHFGAQPLRVELAPKPKDQETGRDKD